MQSPEARHKVQQYIAEWRANPSLYVQDVIGVTPTWQQDQILSAIARPNARVTVRSGHGTGKSTSAAWSIMWFLQCFTDCRVPVTAPKISQLKDIIWAELAKWIKRIPEPMRMGLEWQAEKVFVAGEEKERFATAVTAKKENPEALSGFHAKNVLYIAEEASGIPDNIFETVEGALSTEGARMLMISNPTRLHGYFHLSHTKDRASWTPIHLSSLDSPLCSKDYAARIEKRYGKDSNFYRVRVLGEFPKNEDDTLILLEWLEDAVDRDVKYDQSKRIAGIDIARYGSDDSALVIRQGGSVIYAERWHGNDTMQSTGRIVAAYKDKRLFDEGYVDAIGVGAGVADRCKELMLPITGVNVAESSSSKEKYYKLRDELWWMSRDFFQSKTTRIDGKLELKDDLIGELSTPKYSFMSNGQIKVESKDDMKKRGVASPNLADALNNTFMANTMIGAAKRQEATQNLEPEWNNAETAFKAWC